MPVKAWASRIAILLVGVGIVGLVAVGGDAEAAIETGWAWSAIAGVVVAAIKELIQTFQK